MGEGIKRDSWKCSTLVDIISSKFYFFNDVVYWKEQLIWIRCRISACFVLDDVSTSLLKTFSSTQRTQQVQKICQSVNISSRIPLFIWPSIPFPSLSLFVFSLCTAFLQLIVLNTITFSISFYPIMPVKCVVLLLTEGAEETEVVIVMDLLRQADILVSYFL